MSFTGRLMIWFHVAFVIFTIGPVTIAALATPRCIRGKNVAVLRYLLRTTRIFGVASVGVLAFGIAAGQELHKLGSAWITVSITLFVVALVLLVLIMRDQRRAVTALESAAEDEALTTASSAAPAATADAGTTVAGSAVTAPGGMSVPAHAASVERGRIASMAGIVSLIWLAILVLMIWQP